MIDFLIAAAALMQPEPALTPVQQTLRKPPAVSKKARRKKDRTEVLSTGTPQPIRTIVFQGTRAPRAVAAEAEKFLGMPGTRQTLQELAGALARAYERTDIALYTVAIPEQSFKDGVVVVELVEGYVNGVQLAAPSGSSFPLLSARANRLVGEKPLSRSRFERQSSLMQAIPGLTLDASFENPEGDDSVVLLLQPRQKRVEGAVGVNNRGPHLLGDLIVQGGVDFYRMVTDGDQLSFSAYATPDVHHYRAIDAGYALPIGADGLTLTANAAWIGTRARHMDIHGKAKLAGLMLTYPILRAANRAADIGIGIDGVNSDNALFGNVFATEKSRAARLSGAFASASTNHNLQATLTLSHGLNIFGADVGDTDAEIAFSKIAGAATYEHVLASRLLGRINVTGQYTGDRLPAADLFLVGGPVIGRAFDTGILTGDRGIGGFIELAYQPLTIKGLEESEAYLFGDAASLKILRRETLAAQSFSLASAGAGVRLKYKKRMQLGLEAAAVLDRPYAGYDKDLRLSVYYSILF
jgi:hemolysin activation/secretion protein